LYRAKGELCEILSILTGILLEVAEFGLVWGLASVMHQLVK